MVSIATPESSSMVVRTKSSADEVLECNRESTAFWRVSRPKLRLWLRSRKAMVVVVVELRKMSCYGAVKGEATE